MNTWISMVRAEMDAGSRRTYGGLFRRDTVCFISKAGYRSPAKVAVSL